MPGPEGNSPLLHGGLVALLALMLFVVADMTWEQRLTDRSRAEVTSQLAALRARLEGELNATIFLSQTLATYATLNPSLTQADFGRVAGHIMRERPQVIRSIALVPDNVIRFIYPLEENRAALGANLFDHPLQGDSVRLAMASGEPVLAGPWPLVQGGEALIIRVPVHVPEYPGDAGRGTYWGLASVVIDMDAIYAMVGMGEFQRTLAIAIRGRDGMGAQGDIIFGSPEPFDITGVVQDVVMRGGHWELGAVPREGWGAVSRRPLAWYWAGALLIVLCGGMAWKLSHQALQVRTSELRHRALSERLEAIIAAMPDICFILDAQGRYMDIFGGADSRYYHDGHQALLGKTVHEVLPADKADVFLRMIDLALNRRQLQFIEYDLDAGEVGGLDADSGPSEPQWFEGRIMPLGTQVMGRPAVIWLSVNITQRKKAQDRIRHLALHDPLTGLANRTLLQERLIHALERSRRHGTHSALMFLDLDEFKPVNDRFGHAAGDRLLCEVARRLESSVRAMDMVARLGGDEFVILLEDFPGGELPCVVAEKLLAVLGAPIPVQDSECTISGSIGISIYPIHGEDHDTLMRHADQALYQAKSLGKNRYRVFTA
ncbi:sensor domain-containing diguanylate cyclase [Ectothiorhodospira lacustris]|uniref:sensor domain-containing diguanylate cyclase n=1 Tax=Ectothiorhodospira lacustris TaxID=2899127 RepID=UPI001EE8E97C|nr:diguanylate cyclase [Ectothiorhodospira lacustris]MCG5500333.1 diguanylate cyclase [Ectothiorhodospira lacustris]MCG5510129.1 diguanylate cyclase [Ectothiorhodospira lacustris]MCG5521972.1 diguanylate cyclase [Ectothiorhodospira lacustris]